MRLRIFTSFQSEDITKSFVTNLVLEILINTHETLIEGLGIIANRHYKRKWLNINLLA